MVDWMRLGSMTIGHDDLATAEIGDIVEALLEEAGMVTMGLIFLWGIFAVWPPYIPNFYHRPNILQH